MTKVVHVMAVILSLRHSCDAQSAQDLLDQVLPSDYDKTRAPNETQLTDVFVQLHVSFVGDVSESNLDFPLQAWISLLWSDPRVDGEPLRRLGLKIVPAFVVDAMWVPSVSLDSAKEVAVMSNDVFLRPDGFLLWHRRMAITVHCSQRGSNFLFDARSCDFVLGSSYERGVRLGWVDSLAYESVVRDATARPLEYDLTRIEPRLARDEPGSSQRLVATFHFSKRPLSVLVHTYIPSAIVVFVSWVSFWIEASMMTTRFTLGIVCLLVLSFQATQSRIGNPVGTTVRAADVWVFMSTVLVFLSLVECAVASNLYREQEALSRRDVAEDVRYGYRLHRTPSRGCIILCDAATQTEGSQVTFGSTEIDQLARMGFPVAFFFCCCFYVLWFATSAD